MTGPNWTVTNGEMVLFIGGGGTLPAGMQSIRHGTWGNFPIRERGRERLRAKATHDRAGIKWLFWVDYEASTDNRRVPALNVSSAVSPFVRRRNIINPEPIIYCLPFSW